MLLVFLLNFNLAEVRDAYINTNACPKKTFSKFGVSATMAALAASISVICLLPLASRQCVKITSPLRDFCPFYNYTSLDQTNQVQEATFIQHLTPLFLSNCSTLSNICASYSLVTSTQKLSRLQEPLTTVKGLMIS